MRISGVTLGVDECLIGHLNVSAVETLSGNFFAYVARELFISEKRPTLNLHLNGEETFSDAIKF